MRETSHSTNSTYPFAGSIYQLGLTPIHLVWHSIQVTEYGGVASGGTGVTLRIQVVKVLEDAAVFVFDERVGIAAWCGKGGLAEVAALP